MQYEYRAMSIGSDEIDNSCQGLMGKLNEAGNSGWELVSIFSLQSIGSSPYNLLGMRQRQFLVLKRPLPQRSTE